MWQFIIFESNNQLLAPTNQLAQERQQKHVFIMIKKQQSISGTNQPAATKEAKASGGNW